MAHGREWTRSLAAAVLACLLYGCVADPNPELAETAVAAEPPPGPPPDKEPIRQKEPATEIAVAPPARLIGMTRSDIIKHLGKPFFQRRDRAALLLRYREGRCILDLFLYPRGQAEPVQSVDYIEARATDGKRIETRPCVIAVRKANTAG